MQGRERVNMVMLYYRLRVEREEQEQMQIGLTKAAYDALTKAGCTPEIMQELSRQVIALPKKEFDIDTFDGLECCGVALSFLREHSRGFITIMTRAEAYELDRVAGRGPGVDALKSMF